LSLPFTAKAPVSISNIATYRMSEKFVLNLSLILLQLNITIYNPQNSRVIATIVNATVLKMEKKRG